MKSFLSLFLVLMWYIAAIMWFLSASIELYHHTLFHSTPLPIFALLLYIDAGIFCGLAALASIFFKWM